MVMSSGGTRWRDLFSQFGLNKDNTIENDEAPTTPPPPSTKISPQKNTLHIHNQQQYKRLEDWTLHPKIFGVPIGVLWHDGPSTGTTEEWCVLPRPSGTGRTQQYCWCIFQKKKRLHGQKNKILKAGGGGGYRIKPVICRLEVHVCQ